MNSHRIRSGALLSVFCTIACVMPGTAGAQSASDTAQVRVFAQAFYKWYVPLVPRPVGDPLGSVLRERPSALTSSLLAVLREERAIELKATDHVDRLGADPF